MSPSTTVSSMAPSFPGGMAAHARIGHSRVMTATSEWSDLAERTEAAAMRRLMTDQPPAVVEALGVSASALGDGVHTMVVRDPMWGYWNKALGFCESLREATVAEAVEGATRRGVPTFAIQVQPKAIP